MGNTISNVISYAVGSNTKTKENIKESLEYERKQYNDDIEQQRDPNNGYVDYGAGLVSTEELVDKPPEVKLTPHNLWDQWLFDMEPKFKKYNLREILSNQTPYNIDSVRELFTHKYYETFGIYPNQKIFKNEIKRICRPQSFTKTKVYDYTQGYPEGGQQINYYVASSSYGVLHDTQYDTQYY